MPSPRFYEVSCPFSIDQLATIADAEIAGANTHGHMFTDVCPLDNATGTDVSFLDNKRYVNVFRKSHAGLCVVDAKHIDQAPSHMALLVTKTPYHAFARIAQAFYPVPQVAQDISTAAHISSSAKIGKNCTIAAGAVVGHAVEIGDNCRVGANTVISDGVIIGNDCDIRPLVTLAYCHIAHNVIIHTGVRIGQDGFGFAMGPEGHLKVPQLGRVIIKDNVEIGANTTIDRGTGPDTVIGSGCKIDNLVQIGHNVKVGNNAVIVSQVGISGSTTLGDFTIVAGQVGIAGHLKIGAGVQIAAQSGVMRDVAPGMKIGGSPAKNIRDWLKEIVTLEKLSKSKRT